MEQIRVLQVIGGLNRGGAETMIMNLYRAIDKSSVQFDFVIHRGNENAYCDEVRNLGGKIYVFPEPSAKNLIYYRKCWKNFLEEHPEYKILHSHVRSYAILFLGIAKKLGLTTIVHSHSTSNGGGIKSYLKSLLQLPLRKTSDYLFACSTISGEWLFGKKAIKQPNYKMIKNAIDCSKYVVGEEVRKAYRQEMGIDHSVVYGHVGRLSEPKNHAFLLQVFCEILKTQPNAILMIVGEGAYRERIETQIAQLGIEDKVIMTGRRNDIPQILSAMDVFLFPSLWEGLPVTVIEAQAAGLPCLISDKITDEVAVSNAVTYLPIDQGVDCWVEGACTAAGKRFSVIEGIKAAGFDVHESAEELTKFYKDVYE